MARAKGITGNLEIIAAAVSQKNALAVKTAKAKGAAKPQKVAQTLSAEDARILVNYAHLYQWNVVDSSLAKASLHKQVMRAVPMEAAPKRAGIPAGGVYLIVEHGSHRGAGFGISGINLYSNPAYRVLELEDELFERFVHHLLRFGVTGTLKRNVDFTEKMRAWVKKDSLSSTRASSTRARKKSHPATTISREWAQKIAATPASVNWALVKSNKNNKNVKVVRIFPDAFRAELGFTQGIPSEGCYLQLRNQWPNHTSIASYNGVPILNLSADLSNRILDHLRIKYNVNLFGESNVTINRPAAKVEATKVKVEPSKVESIATASTRESRRARLVELLREMASLIESAV